MGICICSDPAVGMTEDLRHSDNVNSGFQASCGEGVPQGVKGSILNAGDIQQFFIVLIEPAGLNGCVLTAGKQKVIIAVKKTLFFFPCNHFIFVGK